MRQLKRGSFFWLMVGQENMGVMGTFGGQASDLLHSTLETKRDHGSEWFPQILKFLESSN